MSFNTKKITNTGLKTNKLTKFLLVALLCLVPMIVVWVLLCQFNILGLNWVITTNSKYYISTELINEINSNISAAGGEMLNTNDHYYVWKTNYGDIQFEATIKVIAGFGSGLILHWAMYVIVFSILLINLVVYLSLIFASKKIYLDVIPMFLATWFGMSTLIFSGLIPQNQAYTIAVQVIIIIIAFVSVLLLSSWIFNKIIMNSKWANDYYEKIIKDDLESKTYYDDYLNNKNKFSNKDTTIKIKE